MDFETNTNIMFLFKECMCTSCCLQNAGIGMLRSKIRGAYKIEGSVCGDCITGVCCPVSKKQLTCNHLRLN